MKPSKFDGFNFCFKNKAGILLSIESDFSPIKHFA